MVKNTSCLMFPIVFVFEAAFELRPDLHVTVFIEPSGGFQIKAVFRWAV